MKRLITLLLPLALALSLHAQDNALPDPTDLSADAEFKRAYASLTRADEARDAGRDREASRLYSRALEAYSRLSDQYPDWQVGVVHFRINYCNNQIETLSKHARSAVTVSGDMPERSAEVRARPAAGSLQESKAAAGRCLARQDTEQACSILIEALRASPDDPSLRLLMGLAECQAGDYQTASYMVNQLVQDCPSNACAYVLRGAIALATGNPVQARIDLQRSLLLDPALKEAHYNLAQIFLASSPPNIPAARQHYLRALELGSKPDAKLDFLHRSALPAKETPDPAHRAAAAVVPER